MPSHLRTSEQKACIRQSVIFTTNSAASRAPPCDSAMHTGRQSSCSLPQCHTCWSILSASSAHFSKKRLGRGLRSMCSFAEDQLLHHCTVQMVTIGPLSAQKASCDIRWPRTQQHTPSSSPSPSTLRVPGTLNNFTTRDALGAISFRRNQRLLSYSTKIAVTVTARRTLRIFAAHKAAWASEMQRIQRQLSSPQNTARAVAEPSALTIRRASCASRPETRRRQMCSQAGHSPRIWTIPNAICIARICATPGIAWLILTGYYDWAFIGLVLAGISDGEKA